MEEFMSKSNQIRYFFVPEPGLHAGRHLGAHEAKGEILIFVDDDIIVTSGWLEAIKKAFDDPEAALVGGKILPKWEGDIPDWINLFKSETEYGWTIGYLSLLDFGNETKEIPSVFVYGCNFSIRKSVLFECGGFHPDSMPQELIRYRGDGESALSIAIEEKGYKSVYEPKASVYHRIPPERLTVDYFCRRAFNQGISDSYTEIRKKHRLSSRSNSRFAESLITSLKNMIWSSINKLISKRNQVQMKIAMAYEEGKTYHRCQVADDPELKKYVLKENYF